jgi:hypothetical protein
MGRTVRDFQLGVVCNVRDSRALCTELVRSLDASEAFRPSEAARRFVAYHSVANFRAHWTLRLRERLNLPPDENLLPWESVIAPPPGKNAAGSAIPRVAGIASGGAAFAD